MAPQILQLFHGISIHSIGHHCLLTIATFYFGLSYMSFNAPALHNIGQFNFPDILLHGAKWRANMSRQTYGWPTLSHQQSWGVLSSRQQSCYLNEI
jgi:hypothetical protein